MSSNLTASAKINNLPLNTPPCSGSKLSALDEFGPLRNADLRQTHWTQRQDHLARSCASSGWRAVVENVGTRAHTNCSVISTGATKVDSREPSWFPKIAPRFSADGSATTRARAKLFSLASSSVGLCGNKLNGQSDEHCKPADNFPRDWRGTREYDDIDNTLTWRLLQDPHGCLAAYLHSLPICHAVEHNQRTDKRTRPSDDQRVFVS